MAGQFRIRRRLRLRRWAHLNLGRRGASLSLGRRGLTLNVGRRGLRLTVGLPGSGLSYQHSWRWRALIDRFRLHPPAKEMPDETPDPAEDSHRPSARG